MEKEKEVIKILKTKENCQRDSKEKKKYLD